MKLTIEKRQSRQRSQDVLEVGERQQSLAEYLEFVHSGDKALLEKMARLDSSRDWVVKFSAQAALHLVFDDLGLPKEIKDDRKKQIETERWPYEENLRAEAASGKLPHAISCTDLLNEAYNVFPFTNVLKESLEKPSDKLWNEMVSWVNGHAKGPDGPALWYSFLLAVDFARFKSLDLSVVRTACLKQIDQQRMKHPVTKDTVQYDLLRLLALTRLIFPDLIGPASLKPEERKTMYACLARNKEAARQGGGGGDAPLFPEYFYHLALVEAPKMSVDETGIHLSTQNGHKETARSLPERVAI